MAFGVRISTVALAQARGYLKGYADGREAFIFPRQPSNTRQHLRQTGPQTFGSHLELW